MSLQDLLSKDLRVKALLKLVVENPYIERKDLAASAGLDPDEVDNILAPVLDEMYILELASQADSSMESRVPKKVYLVNPEKEEELESL